MVIRTLLAFLFIVQSVPAEALSAGFKPQSTFSQNTSRIQTHFQQQAMLLDVLFSHQTLLDQTPRERQPLGLGLWIPFVPLYNYLVRTRSKLLGYIIMPAFLEGTILLSLDYALMTALGNPFGPTWHQLLVVIPLLSFWERMHLRQWKNPRILLALQWDSYFEAENPGTATEKRSYLKKIGNLTFLSVLVTSILATVFQIPSNTPGSIALLIATYILPHLTVNFYLTVWPVLIPHYHDWRASRIRLKENARHQLDLRKYLAGQLAWSKLNDPIQEPAPHLRNIVSWIKLAAVQRSQTFDTPLDLELSLQNLTGWQAVHGRFSWKIFPKAIQYTLIRILWDDRTRLVEDRRDKWITQILDLFEDLPWKYWSSWGWQQTRIYLRSSDLPTFSDSTLISSQSIPKDLIPTAIHLMQLSRILSRSDILVLPYSLEGQITLLFIHKIVDELRLANIKHKDTWGKPSFMLLPGVTRANLKSLLDSDNLNNKALARMILNLFKDVPKDWGGKYTGWPRSSALEV